MGAPVDVLFKPTHAGLAKVLIAVQPDNVPSKFEHWTNKAARGECAWVCTDCLQHFTQGMPDKCCVNSSHCDGIIKRDKMRAMPGGEL